MSYGWDLAKKKLIDYSLFPLIDMLIWETKTENTITHSVKAVAVYPDGEYGKTTSLKRSSLIWKKSSIFIL
ncbi:DUF6387 family protein [Salmonella enterica]|uniref:DUF6387 family protein n=1 Tax=Salmonella enterica TaxID=28901 RepID=UPI003D2FEDCB